MRALRIVPLGQRAAEGTHQPIATHRVSPRRSRVARTSIPRVYPTRHYASDSTDPALPPLRLRVRLKSSVDIGSFSPQARVVLRALQLYGMILADDGSPWYVTAAPRRYWDDDDLHDLHTIDGSDFEVVDTTSLRNG